MLGEFGIIQRYFAEQGPSRGDVRVGIGDDAAVVRVPEGMDLALAVDTLVAGVHFPRDTTPEAIGHKALAVNLSDMAAMGAEPVWATLSLSLPEEDPAFLKGFSRGLLGLAGRFGIALVGGDTVRGPLTITVQISGLVPRDGALLRSGARIGDRIYVSGTLGDAGAGLALALRQTAWDDRRGDALRHRLDRPEPRVGLGILLRGLATAAIDVSDGLRSDLGHILAASGVGARVEVDTLPRSQALRAFLPEQGQLELALGAGDDYELCFTVAAGEEARLMAAAAEAGVAVTCVGEIERDVGLRLVRSDGSPFSTERTGFDHFQQS